jgi:glucokinase
MPEFGPIQGGRGDESMSDRSDSERVAADAERFAVGVDLGGTKIAAGVFSSRGALPAALVRRPTLASGPAEGTLANLFAAIEEVCSIRGIGVDELVGIGIGTTGPLDPVSGMLLEPETLPRLFHFPLARVLEDRFARSVRIDNDANCFALGEARYGAGTAEEIVLGVTLGTGCGVGIVSRGELFRGATFNAGEVYRAPIAGSNFDAVLSGVGIEDLHTAMSGERLAGAEIALNARAGDMRALSTFIAFGERLAMGLGILVSVVDPGLVVIGGSVAGSAGLFLPRTLEHLPRYIAPSAAARVRIVVSELGERAAAAGAAALILPRARSSVGAPVYPG